MEGFYYGWKDSLVLASSSQVNANCVKSWPFYPFSPPPPAQCWWLAPYSPDKKQSLQQNNVLNEYFSSEVLFIFPLSAEISEFPIQISISIFKLSIIWKEALTKMCCFSEIITLIVSGGMAKQKKLPVCYGNKWRFKATLFVRYAKLELIQNAGRCTLRNSLDLDTKVTGLKLSVVLLS